MTTDILEDLRGDWHATEASSAIDSQSFRRRYRRIRVRLWLAYAGTVVIAAAFAMTAWIAAHQGTGLLIVAVFALLAGLLVSAATTLALHRATAVAYDATPADHLRATSRLLEAEHRSLSGARWVAGILVLASLAALGLTISGHVAGISWLVALWTGTGLAVWFWQRHRSWLLAGEGQRLAALAAELQAAEERQPLG